MSCDYSENLFVQEVTGSCAESPAAQIHERRNRGVEIDRPTKMENC